MFDTTIQILVNSLASALVLSLVAIGFTYIFRVTKVLHLAHGGVYVVGAFVFWWVLTKTNSWFMAITIALVAVTILIFSIEKIVYLPLRKGKDNQSISLVASLGLYVTIVNILALLFGNENKLIGGNVAPGAFKFGNIILTKVQAIQITVGIAAICSFGIYLILTKSRLALRSVSDNKIVSEVLGVNTERERLRVFVAGSLLACIAAILNVLEVGVDPQAGMGITLTAVVVTILVSRLDLLLIFAFALALTLMQNWVEWFLNAQWRNGITFMILLLVILFRTEGVISYNLRKDRI